MAMMKNCSTCMFADAESWITPCRECADHNQYIPEQMQLVQEPQTDASVEKPKPYWERITKMYEKQRRKGIETYGMTLEQNTALNTLERLEYLEEELIDGLMYIEHLKEKLMEK